MTTGRLTALLTDEVNDVLVTDDGLVWVDTGDALVTHGHIDAHTLQVELERILAASGRRLDRMNPVIDVGLEGGARLCAVGPPVAVGGVQVALRRHRQTTPRLDAFGDRSTAGVLRTLVRRRANIVVSGATGAGKTTLVRSLLAECGTGADPTQRIITVEDTNELSLPPGSHTHLVRLETRPPTAEGTPTISAEDLVRTALRLRPDRIVVGEVRGDEVIALVHALNTGHRGCITTCHANSARDALERLTTLMIRAAPTWPTAVVRQQLARSIDVIIHMDRVAGQRRIADICRVTLDGEQVTTHPAVVGSVHGGAPSL
jgi:pilus assembly protein CpaF